MSRVTPPKNRRVLQLGRRGGYGNSNGFYNVTNSALCDLFTRLDRVLAGPRHKRVVVRAAETEEFPSATDGTRIYISEKSLVDAVTRRGTHLMAVFGLNYHELAHVLYTPKLNNMGRMWISQSRMRQMAFNMLEDQRIEHLIRQIYPKMTVYFLASVYKHFFDDPTPAEFNKFWYAYGICAERRYIPRADRQILRDLMVGDIGEDKTKDVERICASYVKLTSITSQEFLTDEQKELVEELAEILRKGENDTSVPVALMCEDSSHKTYGEEGKRRPTGKVVGYREIPGDDGDPLEEGQGKTPPEPKQGDGDGQGQGKDKEDGDPKDGQGGGGGGEGEKKPTPPSQRRGFSRNGSGDTREKLEVVMEGSVEIQQDLQMAEQTITKAEFNLQEGGPKTYADTPVTGSMRKQRDMFARQLENVQTRVDPGWEHYTDNGRLNVNRAMQGEDPLTVFDSWQEDQSDALKIEAKLLADMSGSMSGEMIDQASKALWTIASALDKVDAEIDIIGYSDTSFQLHPRGVKQRENSYKKMNDIGGTNPRVAIAKSRYDFESSQASHKLFLIYTDGGWQDSNDDEDIQYMRDNGVTTVMIFMQDGDEARYWSHQNPGEDFFRHNCEHFFKVSDGEQLAEVARKIVTALAEKSAAALGR